MPTNRPKKPMQMGGGKLTKVFANPGLAKFKPRELIDLRTGDHVNGLRMFMMRNAIIMSLMNALRYTGSSVDAPPP